MKNKSWFENKDYYNYGCAYQRNLAAMVDNPFGPGAAQARDAFLHGTAHRRLREVSQGNVDGRHLS